MDAIRCSRSVDTKTTSVSHRLNRCRSLHAAANQKPADENGTTSKGAMSFFGATGSSPPIREATVAIRDADCSTLL